LRNDPGARGREDVCAMGARARGAGRMLILTLLWLVVGAKKMDNSVLPSHSQEER
jgi:hypothetical protein